MKKKLNISNILIEYKYLIGILLVTLIISSGYTFFVQLSPGDSLWNFSNIYKLYNGGKIYNDCNVIITPLFFYVGLALFKLIGANFFSFGIYNVIIFILLEILIYQLFYILNNNAKKSFIEAFWVLMYSLTLIPAGANYNILVLCFVILGIILNIKLDGLKSNILLQGIICFITFFTKQNVGVMYIGATILYNIYIGIVNKSVKKRVYIILQELMVAGILLVLSITHMYFYGNLEQFINYTILGIGEFVNNNSSQIILEILAEILVIVFIFLSSIVIFKIFNIDERKKKNIITLFMYALPMILYMYPILNTYHRILGNELVCVIVLYFLDVILEESKKHKIIDSSFTVLTLIVMVIVLSSSVYKNIQSIKVNNKTNSIYFGIYTGDENEQNIENICRYIEERNRNGIEVKIISYKAMLYMSPLKINNKEFDLPFHGNLGKGGKEELIKKISDLENTEILITKDEKDKNYQESNEVREYIMENLIQIGEIEEFYIYKTKIYQEE